ncbi:segregation and condensation protein A [Zafaria sp. Z1313]|uniref:segregation and condensation protein A n=1 Tax=unclassified Zafaria TaxID=2828765 RepID=UPI002E79EB40|nr:segregation/condensation protein A [Zafaria sp. J156]MEE1622550.1 segregation/condensation protein A [Zafaria sp. J156]
MTPARVRSARAEPGPQDAAEPARTGPDAPGAGFAVVLDNFSGPFEVLLNLIGKRQLDITEIALAEVTDEFIAYLRGLRERIGDKALDETTHFLVVAATLLDLKAARLLPSGEVESEEDIAVLEARDLLFARLLQYKAFKAVAAELGRRLDAEAGRYPRQTTLEPEFAALLPELLWRTSPAEFAAIAEKALAPKPVRATEVGLEHLHAPPVSVREQAELLAGMLRGGGARSFRSLTRDAGGTLVVVARFLALLEMFRDQVVAFEQAAPLAELLVRWSGDGSGWTPADAVEEYDAGARPASAEREGTR